MCGIVGWIGGAPDVELARQMRERLSHRGPDDTGEWWRRDRAVWLGHRRLAVVDPTPGGHQPMESSTGRYVLTYNGEVYNAPELRRDLEGMGHRFRGHSDTEVLLEAVEAWGVEGALERLVGMFAFGLYDLEEATLWLARDRLGIKPLFYAHRAGEVVFASELRALSALDWLDRRLDGAALDAYFRFLCVPAPATIFRGARKLAPGHLLRWRVDGFQVRPYWALDEVVRRGLEEPIDCSFHEASEELERRLGEAVRLRLLADVPLGAFLSGGVDSSLVVALLQAQSSRPIRTFSIGFEERSHDESRFARTVAAHLGTEHRDEILTPADFLELIPKVGELLDEPFADSSLLPTYLLSRFARDHVTVCLSGDGGDELFGGYPRYFWASRIEGWQRRLTPRVTGWLGRALQSVPAPLWDGPVTWLGGRRYAGSDGLSARVRRLGGYLSCRSDAVYDTLVSAWPEPRQIVAVERSAGRGPRLGPDTSRFSHLEWSEQMIATDQANYLVDDILNKVDRASMGTSLEVRVPLLDHRLVEWSWRVPLRYKLASRGDRGKLLLRDVLYRHVPAELIERPKMGFSMPMARWLRRELRPWAESLLDPTAISAAGVLDPRCVERTWRAHLRGEDRTLQLWTVLMFQQWVRAEGVGCAGAPS